MKVGELKQALSQYDDNMEVNFCIGTSMSYSIAAVYDDGRSIWLDSEEPVDPYAWLKK